MDKAIYIVVNYEYNDYKEYQDDYEMEEWDSCSPTTHAYTDIESAYHKARYLAKQEASCCARPYELVGTNPKDAKLAETLPEVGVHFTEDDTISVWAVVEMNLDVTPTEEERKFEDSYPEKKTLKDFDHCCNCRHWTGAIGGESGYCRYRDRRMTDGMVIMGCVEFDKKE